MKLDENGELRMKGDGLVKLALLIGVILIILLLGSFKGFFENAQEKNKAKPQNYQILSRVKLITLKVEVRGSTLEKASESPILYNIFTHPARYQGKHVSRELFVQKNEMKKSGIWDLWGGKIRELTRIQLSEFFPKDGGVIKTTLEFDSFGEILQNLNINTQYPFRISIYPSNPIKSNGSYICPVDQQELVQVKKIRQLVLYRCQDSPIAWFYNPEKERWSITPGSEGPYSLSHRLAIFTPNSDLMILMKLQE